MTDRTITIYGKGSSSPMGRHSKVTRLRLPFSGHLVVHTVDYTMTYAAGVWQTFSDTHTEVPVVPGPAPADPFLNVARAPHSAEVHEAMQIHCCCEQLRCPILMNEATSGERKWWQIRGHHAHGVAGTAGSLPLQRCVHEIGHDTADVPHEWFEGGWPYGPAQHHPACPRHPDVYNRAALVVEGQQAAEPAGVTTTPDVPESDRLSATAVLTGPAERPSAHTVVRPFVRHRAAEDEQGPRPDPETPPGCGIEDHPSTSHYCRGPGGIPVTYPMTKRIEPGNSGPGGPLPPRPALVQATHNLAARTAWQECGLWYPESLGHGRETLWCTWRAEHAGDTHSTTTQGGDRLYW